MRRARRWLLMPVYVIAYVLACVVVVILLATADAVEAERD
jgi:hypothetical protein